MHHKPMTYIGRHYDGDSGTYGKFVVHFCSKDGKRATQTFDTARQYFAFMDALQGLGFKRKRR